MKKKVFMFLVGLLCSCNIVAQNEDYSWEQFHRDVKSRDFEKPITFLKNSLVEMESNPKDDFSDSTYIGMTTILASVYVQKNLPYAADSLLNHAIDYLLESKKTSQLAYALFLSYGGLHAHLQNYNLAKQYLISVVNFLRNKANDRENYAVALSMLSLCHQNTDSLSLAKTEIDEAIDIIEKIESQFSLSNKVSIYQKAGAIYYELGILHEANKYMQLAYDLSDGNEMYTTQFISSALNLSISLQNQGKYQESIEILQMLEKKPLTNTETISVYQNLFLAYYFLDNEQETVKYANLCSDYLRTTSSDVMSSFPAFTIEDFWQKSSMQLKVNMGILDKFNSNRQALSMSYDNALFLKNFSFNQMEVIRDISKKNNRINQLIQKTKAVKSKILSGNSSCYNELNQFEKEIISEMKNVPNHEKMLKMCTWDKVRQSLGPDECAIEIISYSGFINENPNDEGNNRLKYGALILFPTSNSPKFVELCSFHELYNVLLDALRDNEYGINELYKKDSQHLLYNLIWANIEKNIIGVKTVYISPILDMLGINIGYIPCQDNRYVNEKFDIHTVFSTSAVCNTSKSSMWKDASIYGGVKYSENSNNTCSKYSYRSLVVNELSKDTRSGFGFLKSSEYEADSIYTLINNAHYNAILYKGLKASEKSFRSLDGKAPSIIHLATHGFYLVGLNNYSEYFSKLVPYALNNSSMLMSGLLLANANNTLNDQNATDVLDDGILTAEEISWLDLDSTNLAVLSACETAFGRSSQEGIGGLLKAFKNAGVEHIIASLWKVPDDATAKLMISFYTFILSGETMHSALIKAQKETSLQYPDPYYWAGFILLD